MSETPNFAKQKFLYRLSRSDYEKEWGKDYVKPGLGTRILSSLLRFMPKVGPFKGLAFNNPTPQTEDLYIKSINTTVDQYRVLLEEVRAANWCCPTATWIVEIQQRSMSTRLRTLRTANCWASWLKANSSIRRPSCVTMFCNFIPTSRLRRRPRTSRLYRLRCSDGLIN
jgi:hypothetical protein